MHERSSGSCLLYTSSLGWANSSQRQDSPLGFLQPLNLMAESLPEGFLPSVFLCPALVMDSVTVVTSKGGIL